jgi:hypothetical protein
LRKGVESYNNNKKKKKKRAYFNVVFRKAGAKNRKHGEEKGSPKAPKRSE